MRLRGNSYRHYLVLLHDLGMVAVAWLAGFLIRYEIHPSSVPWETALSFLPFVLAVQLLVFALCGAHRSPWRFASIPDAWNIGRVALLGTLAIATVLVLYNRLEGIPRSVLVLYPAFLILLLSGPRLAYRLWKDRSPARQAEGGNTRVLALGAGSAGNMLARDLKAQSGYELVGFLDDSPSLRGAKVREIPVLGSLADLPKVAQKERPDLLIIAMPSASNTEMQRAVQLCEETGLPFRTLPRLQDLVTGKARFTDLQEVGIEDLLGRDPVELDKTVIGENLRGRTVLVSGAGGSIGSELCRQIAPYQPRRLILLEASEFNLYRIERELQSGFPDIDLCPALADVRDRESVEAIFAGHRPELVFHAAAYKHVPLLETHPREAIRNNVFGTRNLAQAADIHEAEAFVLISTDKAVNPTNVMGASKRVAEIYCQNLDRGSETRFATVRFGNVLDSAGSVVPAFREQIAKGGPVTVTHPEITRYFMTIGEACQLILQAEAMGEGGEIFVLEMGEPVAIRYLAEQMIRLSGKTPGEDIEISYTGLRPGEKLQEELFHDEEETLPTAHQKILQARFRETEWDRLQDVLERMWQACGGKEDRIPGLIRELVPEYRRGAGQETEEEGGRVVPFRGTGV